MSAEYPTPSDPGISRQFIEARAVYESSAIRLLGDPRVRREHVPPELREEYDKLRGPSTERPVTKIQEAIESLESIDGSRPTITYPNAEMGNYIGGILRSLHVSITDYENTSVSPLGTIADVKENRPRIVEALTEAKATRVLVEVGVFESDFLQPNTQHLKYVDGLITGYEWALGKRDDLGVDVQGEIDKFPHHSLRTNRR